MKDLLELPALGSGVTVLFMKLTILLRIVQFRCRGQTLRLSLHQVSLHFHQYASRIRSEVRVPSVRPWPPVSSSCIPVCRYLGPLGGVCAFNADFRGSNEIGGLPQDLSQGDLILLD